MSAQLGLAHGRWLNKEWTAWATPTPQDHVSSLHTRRQGRMLPGWWAGTRGEQGNPEVGTYPCPRGDRVELASGHGLPAPWRVSGRGGGL